MTAQATDDEVKAFAELASSQAVAVGTFGNTRSRTRTAVTGVASAVAEADSTVSDIALGPGGLIKIGSVTSTAKATTDGKLAKVEGSTVTTGATIAGVPVNISDKGVVVAGNALPLGDAQKTVNAAIKQAGLTVAVSQPTSLVDKGSAQYRAGSLVFVFDPQPDRQYTAVLGGAAVEVAAEPALALDLGGTDVPVTTTPDGIDTTGGFTPGTPGTPAIPGTPGTAGSDPLALEPGTGTGTTTGGASGDPVLAEPVAAASVRDLPGGIPVASAVLGLLGAALLFAGMRRLPDSLLEQTPTTRCALAEGAP